MILISKNTNLRYDNINIVPFNLKEMKSIPGNLESTSWSAELRSFVPFFHFSRPTRNGLPGTVFSLVDPGIIGWELLLVLSSACICCCILDLRYLSGGQRYILTVYLGFPYFRISKFLPQLKAQSVVMSSSAHHLIPYQVSLYSINTTVI